MNSHWAVFLFVISFLMLFFTTHYFHPSITLFKFLINLCRQSFLSVFLIVLPLLNLALTFIILSVFILIHVFKWFLIVSNVIIIIFHCVSSFILQYHVILLPTRVVFTLIYFHVVFFALHGHQYRFNIVSFCFHYQKWRFFIIIFVIH